jgi:FkbM family methyltransferase
MSVMSSSREGPSGDLLHVITSFHLKLSRDVLEDNVKIALLNARTTGVAATHVLLEGDREELFARLEPTLAEQLSREIEQGKVVISTISTRPTYADIFRYSNSVGDAYVAIANSDILLPVETVDRIVASGLKPAQSCFALTRWNVTPNGMYIQGMTPSPPWPERDISDMRRHEQNFFSYDAYVFRAPIAVPPDTAGVFIGSLGCDTTLGAVLKASGYVVSNPAFALRIAHFDAKPRSYRSPSSIADLDRNVEALNSAFRRPEAGLPDSVKGLLDENGVLARGRLWFGHPEVGKFGRALHRAIGASPWSDTATPTPLKFKKLKVDRSEIVAGTFDLAGLIAEIESGHIFIEWELTGYDVEVHVIDALLDSAYRDMAQAIKQYQWQAFQAPQRMSADDLRLYDDVMVIFRRTLAPALTTGASLAELTHDQSVELGSRMASLMLRDLEDGSMGTPRNVGPPPVILMIDPDALNGQGHYLPYDLQLRKAAAAKSVETSFLMNAEMDPTFVPQGMKTYRLLDSHSWEIASRGTEHPRSETFVRALTTAITEEKRVHGDRPLIVYMYCGSFEHARLIQEVLAKFDGVGAVVHLFWLSVESYKSDEYLNTWAHFASTVAKDPRIRLTVATENLQAILRKKTGVYFDVAPHPSTTFEDNTDVSKWPVRRMGEGVMPVVLFPGAMREEKGFLTSMDAVKRLTTGEGFKFKCLVAGRSRADTPAELINALASVENTLVSVESQALSDDDFVEFIAGGDVVVLPYKASAFSERPSGILIDAITLGRPVVAIEGTWLADAVKRYGWGEVAADEGAALTKAITKVVISHHVYVDAVRTSREGYIQQNSWAKLVKSIVNSVRPGASRPAIGLRIVSRERDEHISVDETGVVAHLLSARTGRTHTMLDVGAHIGTSAAYFNRLDWMIHCFEPDPVNRAALEAEYGDKANVVIDSRAVSDEPASDVSFYKSEESTGISALHAFRDTHRPANRVDVTTISDYVKAWGINKVDFLKIDVEGFDFSVLKGVPWDHIKPDVIECEYEDAKTRALGHTWEDIARFLRDMGYAVYISEWHPIIRYGVAHDWRRIVPYPGRAIPTESWGNILAFRMDPGYAAVKEAFDACLVSRNAPVAAAQPAALLPQVVTESALLKPDDLKRFRNLHAGKRCFVMGNGPSLNKMDLSKLDGEIVFGCNSIFLLFDRIRWRPAYFTCVDSRVLPDRAADISRMLRDNPSIQAFFPTELHDHISEARTTTRKLIEPQPNIAYFREHWNSKDYPPFSMFSVDINEHIIQPFTVAITMLQIAMYMGFSEIYLIGCDTSYTIPPDVKKEGMTERGEIGLGLTSTQDNDPNHFDPSYFGKGRKWHDPQVDKMIDHYRYARQVSELRGKTKISNATVGGNLEVFPRVDFNTLFARSGAEGIAPSLGRIGNGGEFYSRPVQGSAPAPGPLASPAEAQTATSSSAAAALTLFPIGATSSQGSELPIGWDPAPAIAPGQATIQPVVREPFIQPAVAGAGTVRMHSPVKPSSSTRVMKQTDTTSRRDIRRWVVNQVLSRRMAQLVLAMVVGLAVAAGLLFAMPPQGDLRPMLFAGAGVGLLGVGGLYFAYRVVRLAQRLSAENAALQQRLVETAGALERLKRDTYNEHARQSSTLTAIAGRIERSLASNVQDVVSRISGLDSAVQARAAAHIELLGERAGRIEAELAAVRALAEAADDVDTLKTRVFQVEIDLTRVTDRIADLGDIAKGSANATNDLSATLEQQAIETREKFEASELRLRSFSDFTNHGLEGLNQRVSTSDARLLDVRARMDAESLQVSQLGDRLAYIDDITKGIGGSVDTLAGEIKRYIGMSHEGLETVAKDVKATDEAMRRELAAQVLATDVRFRVADERMQGLGRLVQAAEAAGAAEVAALESQITAMGAKAGQDVAAIGNQLAEVASLSQSLTAEVLARLMAFDDRASDAADRIASSENAISALMGALHSATAAGAQEVASLENEVKAVAAGIAEQRSWAEKRLEGILAQTADSARELSEGLSAVNDRVMASDQSIADLGARLDLAAGAQEVASLENEVKAVAAGIAEQRSWAEKRLEGILAQTADSARELSEGLSAVNDRVMASDQSIADLGVRLNLADVAAAEAVSGVELRIAEFAARSESRIADLQIGQQSLDQKLSALDSRTASSDAALAGKADVAGLADLTGRHLALVALIEESESAGARALGELEDRIGVLHEEARSGLGHMQQRLEAVAASEAVHARALDELGLRLDGFSSDSQQRLAALRAAFEASLLSKVDASEVAQIRSDLSAQHAAIGAALNLKAEATDVAQANREIAELSDLSAEAALDNARMDAKISASIVDVSALESKLIAAEKGLEARLTEAAVEAAKWAQKIAVLESQHSALTDALAAAEQAGLQQVTELRSAQYAARGALAAAEAASGREVARIEQSISSVSTSVAAEFATLEARLKALVAAKVDPSDLVELKREIVALGAKTAEAKLKTDQLSGQIEEVAECAQIDNAAAYRPFNRKLQLQHIEVLEKYWAPRLSLSVTRAGLAFMAARVTEVERELDGRFATSIEDMLLRTLVARATKGASIKVLEVGTFFGAGAAIMFDAVKDRFADAHFTLLDPLDEYREVRALDSVTGLPVNERVVRRNMERGGLGQDAFRLIKRLSIDADAISEASERLYDVLIIDSDRSYAGVKSDFENYAPLVRLGGHIILGGYGSESSPDIRAFVDTELPEARFVSCVGAAWDTVVYRVVQPPQGSSGRRTARTLKAGAARAPVSNKPARKRKR